MHIQEHNIPSHNSFYTTLINFLPKNNHEMNENALPSIEQNIVVTMSGTQTEYADEKSDSPITSDYILDNNNDLCHDEKNSTKYDIENGSFMHKNDDSVSGDL